MGESSNLVFRGRILTPITGASAIQYLEDALMFVNPRGVITAVKPYAPELLTGATVHDVRPWVIAPGFVDAHLHYPQIRVIGSASGPLLQWLDHTVFPEEARFVDIGYARAVAHELVERLADVGLGATEVGGTSVERARPDLVAYGWSLPVLRFVGWTAVAIAVLAMLMHVARRRSATVWGRSSTGRSTAGG